MPIVRAALLLLFLSACQNFALAGPHMVLIPEISFPEKEFDLGEVNEGVELRHTFKIENHGKKKLVIKTAFSTCGCTIPSIKQREILPGQCGDLDVLMDTSMKQGLVSKAIEIHSNDPVNPISTIYIKAKVRSPHSDLGRDKTAKIFTGRCAACHVSKGTGKKGEELFAADCAMCHGFSARGVPAVAPPLVPLDYHNKEFADSMKQIIAQGSKLHKSMPGFAKSAGGPLSDEEIDSLVEYLKQKSDAELKTIR